MDSNKFEMRYYATYYYANIIENVLSDQFSYLRKLNEFYGDGNGGADIILDLLYNQEVCYVFL